MSDPEPPRHLLARGRAHVLHPTEENDLHTVPTYHAKEEKHLVFSVFFSFNTHTCYIGEV